MDKVDFENYKKDLPQQSISTSSISESTTFDPDDTWRAVKELVRLKISDRNFKTWFTNTYIENISNGVVDFSCQNNLQKTTIINEYLQTLKECLQQATGTNFMVNVNTREEEKGDRPKYEYVDSRKENEKKSGEKNLFTDLENEKTLRENAINRAQINPKYTFDTFVVGSHNRLAEAVARASSKELGTLYNPVFFYGNTGVGKTHLMQAIGNEVIKNDPNKQVVYVSIEQFLNEMITSIRSKKEQSFREKYRKVDLLIIDDIQFVETYPKTQEALFHTFNTLYQANKQIVLAADRPPSEIKNLTDRLRSRFEGGMVADIGVPDYETRMAILQQVLEEKNIQIPNEYLDLIAKNIESNVRELEGALNKILSLVRLGDLPTYEEAAKILQVDIASKRKKITPKKVITSVSEVFEVKPTEIKGNRRTAYVALSRQVVMYILRNELELPLEKVAREVNRKDHTTVLHACEKISKMIEDDSRFKEKIESCKRYLVQ
ncbi:MAG: chromosomal replication initiator protein DnaA [Candidatus Dojkabacteria bacterium]|nr:chromosomal replication initiator protein DnaA [Candidatus Dojkabacteria bacterium]